MSDDTLRTFIEATDAWLCDGYALDIRYLADTLDGDSRIWDASIQLNPLPPDIDVSFRVESSVFRVGQIQRHPERKASLLQVLSDAANGLIPLASCRLELINGQPLNYYSEMSHRDRWFSQLHLQVTATQRPPPSSIELAGIDNMLRAAKPPFDGLPDVAAWLGLNAPGTSLNPPSIAIRVGPPADLITDRCRLVDDELTLTIHAHPKFDVHRVGLAIRAAPNIGLSGRAQAADSIIWKRVRNGRREGVAKIRVERADQALAVLLIGESMVRRHWFIDPARARNNRLLAMQYFDKDLRMIKQAVLEATDSAKFENGIAALLFLLGFTPAVQLETDAPDLVVTTPGGQFAIVECTTRTADFATKVGKLVDRRGALIKALAASGHLAQVAAVLICRQPRDQISVQINELRVHGVILLTGEDLMTGFDRVRFPSDPDRLLDDALTQMTTTPPLTR